MQARDYMGNDFATFTCTKFSSASNHMSNYLDTRISIKYSSIPNHTGNYLVTHIDHHHTCKFGTIQVTI